MIFIAAMTLVVLLYFFGFKVIYFAAGGVAVLYTAAVVSARRSPATPEKRNGPFDFDSER